MVREELTAWISTMLRVTASPPPVLCGPSRTERTGALGAGLAWDDAELPPPSADRCAARACLPRRRARAGRARARLPPRRGAEGRRDAARREPASLTGGAAIRRGSELPGG